MRHCKWSMVLAIAITVGTAFGGVLDATAGTAASAAATTGATVASGLNLRNFGPPRGLFVNASGTIYVADTQLIDEWAPGGTSGGALLDVAEGATDVFGDSAGNIYYTDSTGNEVYKFVGFGASTVVALGSNPQGIFVDSAGDIYVADSGDNEVQEWAPGATSGVTVAGGNGAGSAANQLSGPSKVVVDSAGDIYVDDTGNNRVQEWAHGATTGVTVAGGNGAGSAANQFDTPTGLFVDSAGDIYVADTGNNRVQEWAPGATTGVTVAGGNGAGSAANQLNGPEGVFVDGAGNIYVSDSGNGRVQEWGTEPNTAPIIAVNPQSQSINAGGSATFTAAANGAPSPTLQWQQSTDSGSTWSDIAGATSDTSGTYTVSNVPLSDNGYEFRALFTNGIASTPTNAATLTVLPPLPTTSVLLPSPASTVSGDIWLDAGASSSVGIKSVTFEVSNAEIGCTICEQVIGSGSPTLYGWIGGWDTTAVPNGLYYLWSMVTDNLGQISSSGVISVIVDNLPLQTTVIIPSSGSTLSGSSSVLDAVASGTSDVTGVQYEVTGGALSNQVVGTAVATIYGWLAVWNTTTVANGTYTLQSVATEVGGTTATSPGITVTVSN